MAPGPVLASSFCEVSYAFASLPRPVSIRDSVLSDSLVASLTSASVTGPLICCGPIARSPNFGFGTSFVTVPTFGPQLMLDDGRGYPPRSEQQATCLEHNLTHHAPRQRSEADLAPPAHGRACPLTSRGACLRPHVM